MIKKFIELSSAMAITITLALALTSSTSAAPHLKTLSVASLLNPDGTLNMNAGARGVLDLRGWDVTLDSKRGPVLTPLQQLEAKPHSQVWSALPNKGLEDFVFAFGVSGSDLYAGGDFLHTADGAVKNLNHIAKFSGGVWSALPNKGLGGGANSCLIVPFVAAIAISGSDMYVGGYFSQTADGAVKNLGNIAKFSGGVWSALPNKGLRGGSDPCFPPYVGALVVRGSDLYVGGRFTQTTDGVVKNLGSIAKFSGGVWSALPNKGLNGIVRALAVRGSELYIGGEFDQTADGAVKNLGNIAKFSGGVWSALPNNGLDGEVGALAVSGSDLYVGGWLLTQTADGAVTNLGNIAKFSGGAWSALPNNGLDGEVGALAVSGSDLYVGGRFTQTADGVVKNLKRIAKFSEGVWATLPNNGFKAHGWVNALAVRGSDVYVGGAFSQTADGVVKNLGNIAKLRCSSTPDAPAPLFPLDSASLTKINVKLDWSDSTCAASYKLQVKDTTTKKTFLDQSGLPVSLFKVTGLTRGDKYWWQVQACNENGCMPSQKQFFTVAP